MKSINLNKIKLCKILYATTIEHDGYGDIEVGLIDSIKVEDEYVYIKYFCLSLYKLREYIVNLTKLYDYEEKSSIKLEDFGDPDIKMELKYQYDDMCGDVWEIVEFYSDVDLEYLLVPSQYKVLLDKVKEDDTLKRIISPYISCEI
ncbi:MAG: hypothetical protein ACRDD7_08210 [Peptostreptococcaceae bacterium]